MKYIVTAGVILISLLALQTYKLNAAQKEIGTVSLALAASESSLEARTKIDTELNKIKAAILSSKEAQLAANKRYMVKTMQELENVKKHECFNNPNVIPVEHIRVLNK